MIRGPWDPARGTRELGPATQHDERVARYSRQRTAFEPELLDLFLGSLDEFVRAGGDHLRHRGRLRIVVG